MLQDYVALFFEFFMFLVGVFEENARLLQWLVFYFSSVQRDRSTFLFICSTSSTWTTDVHNILETPEHRPKQHRRPEPRKHRIPPFVFFTRIFFRRYATFFEVFLDSTKGSPLRLFRHNGCQKPQRVPLLHFSAL